MQGGGATGAIDPRKLVGKVIILAWYLPVKEN
jgi:hypothetical protein